METIRKWLLDVVFPRHCLGCDLLLGKEHQSYLCNSCLSGIPLTKGFACAFCSSPVRAGKTCVYCARNHNLDQLLVSVSYENPLVEKILKTLKYRFVQSLTDNISVLMISFLKNKAGWLLENKTIEVVPVPLHRRRLNWRGFNQAHAVSDKIAEHFGWSVNDSVLKRQSNPKPQADMTSRQGRIENIKNVFVCVSPKNYSAVPLTGKTVLLIDDVSTTGSTLNDCARALKGAGAKEVIGFVFARGKLGKS